MSKSLAGMAYSAAGGLKVVAQKKEKSHKQIWILRCRCGFACTERVSTGVLTCREGWTHTACLVLQLQPGTVGCSSYRMLLERERHSGLGMDAWLIGCSWNTNTIMDWAWIPWETVHKGVGQHGCSAKNAMRWGSNAVRARQASPDGLGRNAFFHIKSP